MPRSSVVTVASRKFEAVQKEIPLISLKLKFEFVFHSCTVKILNLGTDFRKSNVAQVVNRSDKIYNESCGQKTSLSRNRQLHGSAHPAKSESTAGTEGLTEIGVELGLQSCIPALSMRSIAYLV